MEPTQVPGSLACRGTHGFRLFNCNALRGRRLSSDLGVSNWCIPALVCYRETSVAHTTDDVGFDVAAPRLSGAAPRLWVPARMPALSGLGEI